MNRRWVLRSLGATFGVASIWGCMGSGRRDPKPGPGDAQRADQGGPTGPPTKPDRPRFGRFQTGLNEWSLQHRGEGRRSAVILPRAYAGQGLPLLVGLHGSGGNGATMFRQNGWGRTCDEAGYVGFFPNGLPNQGSDRIEEEVDFLAAAIAQLQDEVAIDAKRVYVTGFSAGARKCYRLAALHSDRVAAIAAHSGIMGFRTSMGPDRWDPDITAAGKVSVLHIHGAKDTSVPLTAPRPQDPAERVTTLEGLGIWAKHNGCSAEASPTAPSVCPSTVTSHHWTSATGHEVQGLIDSELGHAWASGWANAAIVDFFSRVPVA